MASVGTTTAALPDHARDRAMMLKSWRRPAQAGRRGVEMGRRSVMYLNGVDDSTLVIRTHFTVCRFEELFERMPVALLEPEEIRIEHDGVGVSTRAVGLLGSV